MIKGRIVFPWILSVCAGTIVAALLTATVSPSPAMAVESNDMENPFAGDPDAIEYGRVRFSQRCAFCHGGGGTGAKGPALVVGHFKHGGRNEDIFYHVAGGIPGTQMGAFGRSLSGDEIWKIIAYLRNEERKNREAGHIK